MRSSRTRLSEEGFVAEEISDVVAVVRQRYVAHLAEVCALNRLLTQSQYELQIHPQSAQEMTCAALFVRSLAHCQATLILLERGNVPSARAVIRCALEGLFNLGACAADAKLALAFLDADQVDRKRRIRHLSHVQDAATKARLEKAELEKIVEQIQIRIDEVEAKELKTRDMARRAGLEDMYLTAYGTLSGAVHSSVGDIDQHFQTDSGAHVLELVTAPIVDNLEGPYLILGETMVGLMRAAAKVFALRAATQCEDHLSQLHKLYANAAD